MPRAVGASLAGLLLLGLLGPLALSQEQTKDAWTSKTLGKQPFSNKTAVSPDGKLSAELVPDKTVKLPPPKFMGKVFPPDAVVLRDASDKVLATVRRANPKMNSSHLAFSPDGKTLAWAAVDGTVLLIDVKTTKTARQFSAGRVTVHAIAFVGDDKLAVFDYTDTLTTFDAKTGKKLASLAFDKPAKEAMPRHFLVADGKRIFVARGKDLRVTDTALAKWHKQEVLPGRLVGLLLSPDGKTLAAGVDTGKGMNFEKPKDKPKILKEGEFPMLIDLDYSLSFRDADSLKENKSVKLDCKELWFSMAFVPGRSDQVVTGKGGAFTVYDVKTGKTAGAFTHAPPRKKGAFVYSVTAAPGGKLKTFCSEMVMGYDPPAPLPVLLWTPPADAKSSKDDK
jgi:WD40 repeat protein